MNADKGSVNPRTEIDVVTPELHRRGGTERALAEKLVRWAQGRRVQVFTTRFELEDGEDLAVHEVPRLPGPGLLWFPAWVVANHLARALTVADGERDLVYSPGINCLDADVIGVHMTFAKYRHAMQAVRRSGDGGASESVLRRMHRRLYRALVEGLERWIYTGPATLWVPSGAEARFLEEEYGRPQGTVEVVPHGVDAEAFSPSRRAERRATARQELGVSDERVMLLIGNDVNTKGVDTAVRALPELPTDVVLAAAGRFDRGPVRTLARRLDVDHRVRCWPHQQDVLAYYAAGDLFVAPSRQDSFGLPALEAVACGLPAVVSRKAGAAELLEDERSALLLDDPQNPDRLASAVRRVLDSPSLRGRLSEEGRAVAEANDWDQQAATVAQLLDREHGRPRFLVLASDAFETGGIGRYTRTLLDALGESYARDRVGMLSVWGGNDDRLPDTRVLESTSPKGSGSVPWSRQLSFSLRAIQEGLRWRRNLVIIAAHVHLAPLARMVSWASRSPYVVCAYGFEAWRANRPTVASAIRQASQVWALSEYTARQIKTQDLASSDRIRVVHPGLSSELDVRSSGPAEGPVVLTVARLVRDRAYKGVDTLIRALPEIKKSVSEAKLEIVGKGNDRERLQRLAERLAVSEDVIFRGYVSDRDLEGFYDSARLFALPGRMAEGDHPRGEGFGLVFLEAAAAELPVIAGRAGGAAEAVEHGETGFLADPEDPSDVARHLVRLLEDDELAQEMGRAGRERVEEEFSFDAFRERVERLVDEMSWRGA